MDVKSKDKTMEKAEKTVANRDPLTGAAGSHPVGTAVGSVGGAATGAAIGAVVGGPVGAVVGGAVGAVAGAATGHAAGEAIDPTVEIEHWRGVYTKQPYYRAGKSFSDYEPAYLYGVQSAMNPAYRDRDWKAIEGELARGWVQNTAPNRASWNDVRDAAHDAWTRANRSGS